MVQTDSMKNKVVVVCGPTASGKTELSVRLAERLGSEIVSADSIAIYRGLDIGTAKPDESERKRAVHHLIDIVDPKEEFSVAEYETAALKTIQDLVKIGKTPVICGGTGYFIDAILYKKSYGNCPKDPAIRAELDEIVKEKGAEFLHSMLKEADPATAEKLSVNDVMRVSRALEIFRSTGVKKSEITDERTPRFDYCAFMIDYPRETLYERIEQRVDKMFELGLVDEVKRLLSEGVLPSAQSMQGIGYKEVVEGIENGFSEEEIKDIIKRNTRRYAKRQITYFKRTADLHYLKPDLAFDEAVKILENERIID